MAPLDSAGKHEPRATDFAPEVAWGDYLSMPDPGALRLEYEDGKLLVSPPGRNAHDSLRQILAAWLERYEEDHPDVCLVLAEHSFCMPPGRRDYRPDVAVVCDARKDAPVPLDGWMEGAPDIAVEILSDSTRARDLGLKARRYLEEGCDEYWLLDPAARTARFLRRGKRRWVAAAATRGVYTTPMLPGYRLELPRLWARLDAKLRTRPPGGRR